MKSCAIIGAGIAGIASSIRLALKGYQVEVFEANAYLGGKLSEIESKGYRFDAGPSLFTMPFLVDELFELANKNPKDYFKYVRLGIICKYFYEDDTIINAYSNIDLFAKEVAHKTNEDKENILKFLNQSAEKYHLTSKVFLFSSLHKLSTYLRWSTITSFLKMHKLQVFKTMNKANEKLFTDKRIVQLFNRYATYNGSDPYQTPATFNIIPHLEYNMGAYFPQGGMYSITKSLVKLAEDLEVKFHLNSPIQEIILDNKKVKGIRLANGEFRSFEVVVSNIDIVSTYRKLLPAIKTPKKLLNQTKSSSALIFYWGINKEFPSLQVHNIFFSKNYKTEFEHLFQHKSIYQDPTVYIHISSKVEKEDVPTGCENWFVMVNAPNNEGQDWDGIIAETRQHVIKKLNRLLKTNVESLIETEMLLDPRTIESKTSSSQGALYGNSSNNRFAAFLKHTNYSSKIKSLYFCGGSVHPGGGIPLSLLSAKIMSDFVPSAQKQ